MSYDAQGWYWWEKARIRLAWWSLRVVNRFTGAPMPIWRVAHRAWWLLAPQAYLGSYLKAGTMPDHQRIGGVWR